MEIRTKDKIFLAVFLPVAIIFAYVHFWRVDAARSLAALEATHERLVAVDDFPLSKRICEAKIAEAEKELEDEKNIAPAAPHVVADAAATIAVREREAMKVFRESGLVVLRSEAIDSRDGGIDAAAALRATGVCAEPVRRRYTLDGTYPAVKRALDAFCRERMAVVAECITMRNTNFAKWTLEIIL